MWVELLDFEELRVCNGFVKGGVLFFVQFVWLEESAGAGLFKMGRRCWSVVGADGGWVG